MQREIVVESRMNITYYMFRYTNMRPFHRAYHVRGDRKHFEDAVIDNFIESTTDGDIYWLHDISAENSLQR